MNHLVHGDVESFAYYYFRMDQTLLVAELLSRNDPLDMYQMYNESHYTAELSTGTFHGIHDMLIRKLKSINALLKKQTTGTMEFDLLNNDREQLETASIRSRMVYEWYAIPYWLATHLIHQGEVVLIYQGLSWWGRTLTGQFTYKDLVIKKCFDSLISSSSTN